MATTTTPWKGVTGHTEPYFYEWRKERERLQRLRYEQIDFKRATEAAIRDAEAAHPQETIVAVDPASDTPNPLLLLLEDLK